MQISRSADYACRVLIYLATEEKGSVSDIAETFGISQNHLVKVVHKLGQLGFITTTRGRGGGLALAKDPSKIGVGEVIRKMEPHLDLVECFDEATNQCRITGACGLKGVFRDALRAFVLELDRHSIKDVTSKRTALKKLFSST